MKDLKASDHISRTPFIKEIPSYFSKEAIWHIVYYMKLCKKAFLLIKSDTILIIEDIWEKVKVYSFSS